MPEFLPDFPGATLWAVAVGILLLILGRRLYWVSLAVVGFCLGISLAVRLLGDAPLWLQLGAAALSGLICAVLAVFLLKLAVGVAGFLMGGYGAVWIIDSNQLDLGQGEWPVIVLGALISAVILVLIFDLALVVLSSITGAALLVQTSELAGAAAAVLFVVLVLLGMAIQMRSPRRQRAPAQG